MLHRKLSGLVVAGVVVALVAAFLVSGITAAPARATMRVEVDDNYFAPKQLTVPVGTTVVWKSEGHHEHTVTADNGAFRSDDLHMDAQFTHTFATPGTFAYHCKYHGAAGGVGMAGTIVVTAAGSSGPGTMLPTTGASTDGLVGVVALGLVAGLLGLLVRRQSRRSGV